MRISMPGNGISSRLPARVAPLFLVPVLLMLTGCALLYRDLQPPTAELVSIQPDTIEGNLSLALTARVRLSNPNAVKLSIKGGRIEIKLNGSALADSTLKEDFIIPPSGSTDVNFRVNVDLLRGIAIGLNMLNDDSPEVDWQLSGYIDVGTNYLGRVFINESGSVDLGT